MKFIADFHLHSKFSRATSPRMDLENLDKWGRIKGIKLLGTGDFTHPVWLKELKEKLEPAESGLFKIKNNNKETRFILSAEISCIYSKKGRVRKIHTVILAPSFEIVEKINNRLDFIGNLKADGRPILGLDVKELAKIVLNASEKCLIIPAHVMTPWFSLFGSRSGFDSIEECFEEYTKYIYALETGLSADPSMLWRTPEGQRLTLISNSDAHSPEKIGREANIFDVELSYPAIFETIKSKDRQKFLSTIEFFPQEGKYHFDGHRACQVRLSPNETKKYNNICPNCGRPLTVGVLNRIEDISVKPEGFKPDNVVPFKRLVPLREIVAESLGMTVASKKVEQEYNNLVEKLGSEFKILLDISRSDLEKVAGPEIAEGISRVREGKVFIEPGYDGVYGTVKIFSQQEPKKLSKQTTLF
ncbi:MAG TPA: DNA helicase UvrD [bacterium]|nr:DNA helicase UvrD [bacterium]